MLEAKHINRCCKNACGGKVTDVAKRRHMGLVPDAQFP